MNDQEPKTPPPETKPSPTEIVRPIAKWLIDLRQNGSPEDQGLAQTALLDAQQYRTCEELYNLTEGALNPSAQKSLAVLEKITTQRLQQNLLTFQQKPAYTTTAQLVDKALLQFDNNDYGSIADAFALIYKQASKLESQK